MADHSRPVTGYPTNNPYPNPTTATAFPHAAPHPPPYRPPPTPRAIFLRRLIAILLATFVIAGIITLITWLALRPRFPQFRVDSLSLSNLSLSPNSSLLTANWDLRFTVRNPNHKITIYYDALAASLYYKGESISDTTVPPFVLGTRDETALRATFAAVDRYVDGWVVEGISWEKTVRGSVSFNVRMAGWVRFKAGAWRGRRRFLRVYCGELPVGVSGKGGKLVGGPRRCVVGL